MCNLRTLCSIVEMNVLLFGLLGLALAATSARAESVVDKLIASYDAVQSVQVEIRRDTAGGGGSMRRLSRVYFKRPDRLHVEAVTQPRRRIVADGTNFYSYIDGDPKGYSLPVSKLEGDWLISLRQVPGTAMDHLLRLRAKPEEPLPATEQFPTRVGIQADPRHVVLSLDAEGRLARIEFFNDANQTQRLATYDYENFQEAAPGVWFALLQKAELTPGSENVSETTRLSNLAVNEPIPDPLFDHTTFFAGVSFTDSLDEIYGK